MKGYLRARVSRYPNSASTFQISRLTISGDIAENPGPTSNKQTCPKCSRTIAKNHRSLTCSACDLKYHIKCGNVTPKDFKRIQRTAPMIWKCPVCLQDISLDFNELPFASLSEESFKSTVRTDPPYNESSLCDSNSDHLLEIAREINISPKDLKVAHLNICSLRNKVEELRVLQTTFGFDILAITETHLNLSDRDQDLHIDGLKFIRRDRPKCKGGGCILYYSEHLKATHCKDLINDNLEAAWIQVKFPSYNTLFGVVYRSERLSINFFDNLHFTLEKAWMKSNNIFLLGDLNCDLLGARERTDLIDNNNKTRKLLDLFDLFSMQNVVNEPTRVTPTTQSLIDLIATTKVNLVGKSGALPLGLSDHCLIYATLKLNSKRPPPKIIWTRNFKHFNDKDFKTDIERIPFHITVFEDKDDSLWAWEQLFRDVCDQHAPHRVVKARSVSSPWINKQIKLKMNRRFKLFKIAIETKEADKWADYKKLRNEITSDIRKAKSAYFKRKFDEVKTTSAYWNLLSRATNPKARKPIGPLKRDDESLAVDDKEKADLLNCFFATVGMKLADTINPQYRTITTIKPKPVPCIYDARVSYGEVANKLITLKTNKATGPDGISPRLLAAAGSSIAVPLTNLYLRSLREAKVYDDWKVARLNPIFKKHDESDRGSYRAHCLC